MLHVCTWYVTTSNSTAYSTYDPRLHRPELPLLWHDRAPPHAGHGTNKRTKLPYSTIRAVLQLTYINHCLLATYLHHPKVVGTSLSQRAPICILRNSRCFEETLEDSCRYYSASLQWESMPRTLPKLLPQKKKPVLTSPAMQQTRLVK